MMSKLWSAYKADRQGNFAIMAAVSVGILIMLVSAAIEITRMGSAKSKLQSITDMAVLAGAIAADSRDENREDVVLAAIAENSYKIAPMTISGEPTVIFDDATKTVKVAIETDINSVLSKFLGNGQLGVSAESESLYAPDAVAPISIAFALDVSGSMNDTTGDGRIKIDTLQSSIGLLFEALEDGSKDKDKLLAVLRTGMSAYNTEMVDSMPMDYGWEDLNDAVGRLYAEGGTNSVPALQNTYDQLLQDRDFRINNGEDISNLVEYALFMTDGNNNQPVWDQESAAICSAMKADGIELFSIAFAAEEPGEALLLNCASGDADAETGPTEDQEKNADKCMNNGSDGQGNAFGTCSDNDVEDLKESKSDYYHDAENSEAFKEAFRDIGESIAQVYIRIL